MPELITTPLIVVAMIVVVGVTVESIDKGISNLSRSEEIAFLISILVLIVMIAL